MKSAEWAGLIVINPSLNSTRPSTRVPSSTISKWEKRLPNGLNLVGTITELLSFVVLVAVKFKVNGKVIVTTLPTRANNRLRVDVM